MFLDVKWLKTTPALNKNLCKYLGVEPLEFDGREDSIFQEYDKSGNIFMTYLHEYGDFADLPYQLYLDELRKHYPHIFENGKYTNGDLVYNFTK